MEIKIPVQNNVEVIMAEVYIKCDVRLLPISPPRTTEGMYALTNIEQAFNARIYTAIKEAMKKIEEE
jgi:hypothetical protein